MILDFSCIRTFQFHNWTNTKFSAFMLASAGFYYEGEGSFVRCYQCKLKTSVDEWFVGETPFRAHARLENKCPSVTKYPSITKPDGHDRNHLEATTKQSSTTNEENHDSKKMAQKTTDGSQSVRRSIQNHLNTAVRKSDVSATNAGGVINSPIVEPFSNGVVFKDKRYEDISKRYKTFISWNFSEKQSVCNLVEAGFFYTGEKDYVRCFCCNLELGQWEHTDNPWTKHALHSPNCWFLLHPKCDRFVQDIQTEWKKNYDPKHAPYDNQDSRFASFGAWRTDIQQTPKVLAEAGFFYMGDEDVVRCHYCDGGLRNWKPGDDPWEKHARWFPFCKYVIRKKGRDYIKQIRHLTQDREQENAQISQERENPYVPAILATNRKLKEEFLCTRCKTNESCILFVKCGHRVTCEQCSETMVYCPQCDVKITKRMKTFIA